MRFTRMRISHQLAFLCMIVMLAGCYHSHPRPVGIGRSYSGTGRLSTVPPSAAEYAAGLAGAQIWLSPEFSASIIPSTPDPLFSSGYALTGVAQTVAILADLPEIWLHAKPSGGGDLTTLFRWGGGRYPSEFRAIPMMSGAAVLDDDGTLYPINQVCDIAGVETMPPAPRGGHLLLSVVGCKTPTDCAGGLVEVETSAGFSSGWRPRILAGALQATLHRVSGPSANPCLAIAASGPNSFTTHFVAAVARDTKEISVFTVGALQAGPASAIVVTKEGYHPVDVVMVRKDELNAAAFVLWKSSSSAQIVIYSIVNGVISYSPLFTDTDIPSTVSLIESPGLAPGATGVDIYMFADEAVYVQHYEIPAP